jgi:hypothetical protein
MTRSTQARCQVERGADSTSLIPIAHEFSLEDPAAIAEQIAGCRVPGKGFPKVLRGPLGGGRSGHGKVKNPAAVVCQHQKDIQHRESDHRHCKEVDRNHGFDTIFKEGAPRLRWWFAMADHTCSRSFRRRQYQV